MKLKFNFMQKSNNILVVYIVVGIVFVLITVMNFYAYRVTRGMGHDYTTLGVISKELRQDLDKAETNLNDVLLLRKQRNLADHVISYLDKAQAKAKELSKISTLKLDANISKLKELSSTAYSENKDQNKRKKLHSQCMREFKLIIDRLNASDEERSALINNEISFISFIYIILLIGNMLAFGGIFFVIFVNDRAIRVKESKLNAANANFYGVMQGLDSVLISVDNEGIVLTWNNNAERYFEIQKDDIIGKNIYESLPVFKQFKTFFDQVLYSQKRQYNFHEHIHINKGPSRIVDILCVPLQTAGKNQKRQKALLVKMDDVTSFATDESNAVRIRNANLISAGMEQVVKESSALNAEAGGILQTVNELAEAHGLSDEITPYTAYLNNMLAELSIIPQKYAATLHMNKFNNVQIDLNELIMYTLRICLKTFDSGINVEVSQNESKSWIMADPAMLSRALFCLLNNAAEALTEMKPEGQRGGIISVSVEKIAGETIVADKIMRFRHAVKEPPYWVVMISDTGVGISEEVLPNIYDMFFTTKDPDLHKGLGLSIVASIINSLGGFVDINSKPGNGTVFKIYLPEMPGVSEEAESEQTSNLTGDDSNIVYGQGTVLFVSDDIFMRQITGKLIEKFGYNVISCDNGFKALDIYAQALNSGEPQIQCVVSNLTTGTIRNIELVGSLKEMNPACPVAVLVNSEQDEEVPQLREMGITDFIKKPYSMPEFSNILAQYSAAEEQPEA